ncbi:hypothetical protein LguiA_026626 [Lonicera macranthoides]
MSQSEVSGMKPKPSLVPLGTLIGRELRNEKNVEKPTIKYGQAALAKKGEDYFMIKLDCQRIPDNPSTSFSVFAIFDGHNGISAAIFAKENLLNNVLSAIPQGIDREEWLHALPRALVAGFVKTDIEFQKKGMYLLPLLASLCYILGFSCFDCDKLSNAGGRLIIASDGIWDALSSDTAAQSCRGLPAELAAKLVVKDALRSRGLKDDTTCVVVDIIPYDYPLLPLTPRKKQNLLSSLVFGKRTHNMNKATNKLSAVGVVEELFEEGSAMLVERLGKDLPLNPNSNSGLAKCAVCQVDQPQSDGLSVNSIVPFFSPASKPSEGPLFLCTNCQKKKDAMEGKRAIEPTFTV